MKNDMPISEFDVAIIGYGPTGLVSASLLGKAGYKVVVIERWPTPYGLPRLTHIDGETARILQASSDVDKALKDAKPVDVYYYRDASEELLLELDWKGRSSGYPAHISIYQPDIEDAIHEQAISYENVTILRGWEAETLTQTDENVIVTIHPWQNEQVEEWTESPRKIIAKYLIGSDGANSFVRRSLGIDREDFGLNERWLNLDSENITDLDKQFDITTIVCDPARAYMHMPIGVKRTRFELRVLPHESTEFWSTEENGWKWLKEHYGLGPENIRLLRHVVYTFETRLANYWQEGRVLLAGDAAHSMMPYMGQGACSGMRDGINLAWKLDLILSGRSSSKLLNSYEVERRPHVTTIMKMALFLGQVVNEDDPEKVLERDNAFRSGKVPPMPPFPKMENGILHYEKTGELLATTGALAPQGQVQKGNLKGRFDDIVGHGFQLIVKQIHPSNFLNEMQLNFLNKLGCHIAVITDDLNQPDAVLDLEQEHSNFMAKNQMQAYISRPDFVLFGSVSNLLDLPTLIEDLKKKLHWTDTSNSDLHSQKNESASI